jgi:hypothetical protein
MVPQDLLLVNLILLRVVEVLLRAGSTALTSNEFTGFEGGISVFLDI